MPPVFGNTVVPESPRVVNLWGEEVRYEGNLFRQWLPYKWQHESLDPVEKALKDADYYPTPPDRTQNIRDVSVKLPKDFHREYKIMYGKELKKTFDRLVNTNHFQRMPNHEKRDALDKARRKVSKRMKDEMIRRYERKYGRVREE
jgi:hypothetical protein